MGLLLLLLISMIISFLVSFLVFRSRKPKSYPPGPMSLPIIGNLHQIGTHPFIKFMEMRKQYGDIFAIDFGSYSAIVLNDPKLIREALNMAEFSGRPKLRPFLEICGGQLRGVMMNEGVGWQEHRRFTLRNLRDFGFGKQSIESLIQEEVELLLSALEKLGAVPFETKHVFNLAVINSLWGIIIGERFDHQDPKLMEIVKQLTLGISETPAAGVLFFFPLLTKIAPELTGFNKSVKAAHSAEAFFKEVLSDQKKTFKLGESRHFLDVYIQKIEETTNPMSDFYGEEGEKNLIITVIDLLTAGLETTSTTISWTFMLLTVYPEVQEKFFQEIKSIVGLSRLPKLDDEKNLPYTQAVMAEVLRFSSLIPLALFHSTTEDVTFHGFKIPKDTMVIPNLYGVHHDPAIWGDPDIFRPERFITDEGTFLKQPDQHLMPFSTGKRVCLGESLARNQFFLFITSIFQKFKVGVNPQKPPPVVEYTPSFVLQPKSYEYVLTIREK